MPILRVGFAAQCQRVVMQNGNIRSFVFSDPKQRTPQMMMSKQ